MSETSNWFLARVMEIPDLILKDSVTFSASSFESAGKVWLSSLFSWWRNESLVLMISVACRAFEISSWKALRVMTQSSLIFSRAY